MFKCFAWLEQIVIAGMVCRHVGYLERDGRYFRWHVDADGTLLGIAMLANGERVEIEVKR